MRTGGEISNSDSESGTVLYRLLAPDAAPGDWSPMRLESRSSRVTGAEQTRRDARHSVGSAPVPGLKLSTMTPDSSSVGGLSHLDRHARVGSWGGATADGSSVGGATPGGNGSITGNTA